jgi:hypothetical protein
VNLSKGALLGIITASGKYAPYTVGASNGTQTACAILTVDADARTADAKAKAYVHGVFNKAAITGLTTAATLDLQKNGIYVKEVK